MGSSWVTPVTVHDRVSPSASVAPLNVTLRSLWFGGQRSGPAVTAVQTGLWFNVVVNVEELFAAAGSNCSAETVPVLTMVEPALPAFTVIVKVVDAPLAKLAAVHVTVPARSPHPAEAETNVVFTGSASVTTKLVAVEGPLLVTFSE